MSALLPTVCWSSRDYIDVLHSPSNILTQFLDSIVGTQPRVLSIRKHYFFVESILIRVFLRFCDHFTRYNLITKMKLCVKN